jgi:hypothetical protein
MGPEKRLHRRVATMENQQGPLRAAAADGGVVRACSRCSGVAHPSPSVLPPRRLSGLTLVRWGSVSNEPKGLVCPEGCSAQFG